MKYYSLLILVISWQLLSCRENKQKAATETETSKQDEKKNFFPVADYIKSEIGYVDSFPLGIMKYSKHNGKTDSGYIKTEAFDRMAREFLPAELEDSVFEKEFTENSFLDQTTQLLTFTYSTKNSNLGLQRLDVLAAPTTGYDKVRSIYMEKIENKKDTSITRKMYWKARKSFEIITLVQPANQPVISDQLKVVWEHGE